MNNRSRPTKTSSFSQHTAAIAIAIALAPATAIAQRRAHEPHMHRGPTIAQALDVYAQGATPAQSSPDAGAASVTAVSSIDVVVMVGSHGNGGIAPALRGFTQLTRPPFTAFSQIDQVSRAQLPLNEQTAASVAIPNNGTIRITVGPAVRSRRVSVVVTITLGGRTHQTQYSVIPGDPFFLVHSTGVDSALIVRFVPR
jgi:hypothetical protein